MANGTPNITTANRSNGAVVGSTAINNFEVGWTSSSGLDILVGAYVQYGLASGLVNDNEVFLGGPDEATSFTRSTNINLEADRNYKWRGLAINIDTGQTGTGSTDNFKTLAATATATTPTASSITPTTATISCSSYDMKIVDSTGTAYLQYKASSSGTWINATSSTAATGSLSANLTSLTPGTSYDIRVEITRTTENATSYTSSVGNFSTTASFTVTTGSASSIGPTTATIAGTVNPTGVSITYRLEWGPTVAYGTQTTLLGPSGGSSDIPYSANLTGLTPSTTYYFRATATDGLSTVNGSGSSFTTTTGDATMLVL